MMSKVEDIMDMEVDSGEETNDDTMMEISEDDVLPSSALSPIESLPSDAMDIILSCLTLSDFSKLSVVSKKIYNAVSCTSHLHMSGSALLFSQGGGCDRSSLTSSTPPLSSSRTTEYRELRRRQETYKSPPQEDLKHLLRRYQNLNSLHLERLAPVGDDVVSILNESPSASSLTSVSLHGCALSYWCVQSFQLKHLKHISLSGGSIRARIYSLLKHSKNLKSLRITLCSGLRDDDIFDIGLLLHNELQSLTLNQCVGLHRPVIQFPNLNRLNLVGCFGLSDLNGFSCTKIQHLNLSFCIRLTGGQIEKFLEQLPMLEELVMMKCSSVTTFSLSSKRLKRLNLSFCHNLMELRLACPMLNDLENYSCSSLKTFILDDATSLRQLDLGASTGLERLEIRGPNLARLNLQGCKRLDHCQINCPRLEQVNVRGSRTVALRFCRNVRRVLFKSWSDNLQIFKQQ